MFCAPFRAVVNGLRQTVQSGVGVESLPPIDHVPLGHVAQPRPPVPAPQKSTAKEVGEEHVWRLGGGQKWLSCTRQLQPKQQHSSTCFITCVPVWLQDPKPVKTHRIECAQGSELCHWGIGYMTGSAQHQLRSGYYPSGISDSRCSPSRLRQIQGGSLHFDVERACVSLSIKGVTPLKNTRQYQTATRPCSTTAPAAYLLWGTELDWTQQEVAELPVSSLKLHPAAPHMLSRDAQGFALPFPASGYWWRCTGWPVMSSNGLKAYLDHTSRQTPIATQTTYLVPSQRTDLPR